MYLSAMVQFEHNDYYVDILNTAHFNSQLKNKN